MAEPLKGKYVLDRCIGCGGMAEVFIGRTLGAAGFSRQVAIKRIHAVHSRHAQFREMFAAEARLSSTLRHRNVVSVLDFDEDEAGCLFLVMEYVDGIDLDGLLRTGRVPLPAILFVTAEILRGLAYVHDLPLVEGGPLGLVHRDVSPQNVLLSWDGAVQISDFGIAKARAATLAGASVSIKGKPAYMSPEQARGLPLDGRSDVFAVGVMLWEMLCGEALFHDADDLGATLAAVMFGDVPPPSARSRRPIPDEVERVTMQLLLKSRDERPDAAAALAAIAGCADYPRSGREALAALLRERLPERAPRRGAPRQGAPRPPRPAEQPAPPPAAGAAPHATTIAAPHGRPRPKLIRTHRLVVDRIRRHARRSVWLGAVMLGALIVVALQVALGGSDSAAPHVPAAPPPAPMDDLEHARSARPAEGPRAEVPPPSHPSGSPHVDAPRSASAHASPPTTGAARLDTPEALGPPDADQGADGRRRERSSRAPTPASARPPARSGMRIIDLRPEPAGPAEDGARGVDLGATSD